MEFKIIGKEEKDSRVEFWLDTDYDNDLVLKCRDKDGYESVKVLAITTSGRLYKYTINKDDNPGFKVDDSREIKE